MNEFSDEFSSDPVILSMESIEVLYVLIEFRLM